jgi:nucleotide-binding universal stress UspA family protein
MSVFYSKMLVAYDGSVLSDKALDKAIELAERDKDVVLHVLYIQTAQAYTSMVYTQLSDSMERSLGLDSLYGKDVVTQAEKKVSALPKAFVNYHKGDPGEEILKYAMQNHCDVIVMGSRGLSGLKELFLGSVSHYVAQHADVPVLIVK